MYSLLLSINHVTERRNIYRSHWHSQHNNTLNKIFKIPNETSNYVPKYLLNLSSPCELSALYTLVHCFSYLQLKGKSRVLFFLFPKIKPQHIVISHSLPSHKNPCTCTMSRNVLRASILKIQEDSATSELTAQKGTQMSCSLPDVHPELTLSLWFLQIPAICLIHSRPPTCPTAKQ